MNTPVTFEIAKLLKEKGFDNEGDLLYDSEFPSLQPTKPDIYYDAPTISEVVMWLYEKHGIWINVNVTKYGLFWCQVSTREATKDLKPLFIWEVATAFYDYKTPEEAYLAIIDHTLKYLIK